MLRERFYIAIWSLVLINVLFITCSAIDVTANQIIIGENLENELPAEDGPWYNPNSTDIGPISPQIFEIHANLAYLGSFNGKFWYIDRTIANQTQAIETCSAMGMWIAEPNQEELNFLYNVTAVGDIYAWFGGKFELLLAHFKWTSDGSTPDSSTLYHSLLYGLTFYRSGPNPQLYAMFTSKAQFFICAM